MFHNNGLLFSASQRPFAPPPAAFQGAGNIVGSATGWWGLRAYTSASIGANAVRLRESGGNTEQDFATIAGGGLNLAAIATFKGANNLFVRTLYDQVGTKHAEQLTNADQPQFILSGAGSKPVIRFSSPSSRLDTAGAFVVSQPLTISTFAKRTANFTTNTFIVGDNSCAIGWRAAVNQLDCYSPNDTYAAATDSAWHGIQFVANGASSDINVDGTQNTVNSGTSGLGHVTINGLYAGFLDGDVTEFGVWGTNFSTTQSSNLSTNQHTYWGV